MAMYYTADEIAEILPHRYPFALVDRVVDGEPGEWAKGIKCVSINEPFFCGHFPQKHVMPGVLLIEALAQVGGVTVLSMPEYRGKLAYLARIQNARFKEQVTPGDVVELECRILKRRGSVGTGTGRATVNGKTAVEAEMTFFIEG